MIIYLIRHGETNWNKEYRYQGQVDIPLNEYGIKLAETTSEALKDIPFEAVFCSPLGRAVETAKIMMRDREIPFETDERLLEMNFGVCEGTVVLPHMKEDPANPLYYFRKEPARYLPPPNAESFAELYNRSTSFMQERILPLESRYRCILIVGHGALNRSILNPIADIPIEDFWHIPLNNCAVSQITLENGCFQVTVPSETYY